MNTLAQHDQHLRRLERSKHDATARRNEADRKAEEARARRGRGGGGRGVPKSASQYRTNTSYSNRAGKNKAASSSLRKVCYDWMLNATDPETGEFISHGRKKDDVAFTYAHIKDGLPGGARDPVAVATKCYESSYGKRGDTRQMSHHTISLPTQLDSDQLNALTEDLSQLISELHDDVPVFAARHLPDGQNDNHHVHIDHPIHHIVADPDDPDGFKLGDRISHFARPEEREALGLPKTNHQEVRELRKQVAHTIADHMERAGLDYNLCERWRHGHLRLNQGKENQITHAVKRGDALFVEENASRAVTQHEGPGGRRVEGASESQKSHNNDLPTLSPEVLAETVLNRVINDAHTAGLDDWQHVQMLSEKYGLNIKWNRTRTREGGRVKYGNVSGVSYEIQGVKLSGKAVNMPFSKLKKQFPDLDNPTWKTKVSDTVRADFENKLKQAGLNGYNLRSAVNELSEANEAAFTEAATAAIQKAQKSSAKEVKAMDTQVAEAPKIDVQALLKDVSQLPPDEPIAPPPPKQPAPAPTAATPPAKPPRVRVTQSMIDSLTDLEREYLQNVYDSRDLWNTPIANAKGRILKLKEMRRQHARLEPDMPTLPVKKGFIFKRTIQVPNPKHQRWSERFDQIEQQISDTQSKLDSFLNNKVYPSTYNKLSNMGDRLDEQRIEAQQQKHDNEHEALREYEQLMSKIAGGGQLSDREQRKADQLRQIPTVNAQAKELARQAMLQSTLGSASRSQHVERQRQR